MLRILIITFLLGVGYPVIGQDYFTIYLLRHAEKEVSQIHPNDPGLTDCGKERAINLATFFQNINIDVIYSTDYIRTVDTAQPTAELKKKDIEMYNSRDLKSFAKKLLIDREDALVVGHSNTTAVLAGLLLEKEIESVSMSEDVYNRIYQVVICGTSKNLNLFHSAFSCE